MYFNKETDGVFLMPKKALEYVNNAKKSELKVLMYLFAKKDDFSVEMAKSELCESADSIMSAIAYWRGAGIISDSEQTLQDSRTENSPLSCQTPDKTKHAQSEKGYSTLEIADMRKNDSDFSHLVEYIQSVTGELLNSAKQGDLLYLYDGLGMQCDVIMGVAAHCADEDKKKIRYIVKTAEGIHNDGVRSYKELESYLAAKNRYKEYATFVKKLIGAADRALSAAEEKIVKKWESEFCTSRELVSYAYERTIALIAKPSLPYMSKIIEGWHNEGITTLEQAHQQAQKNSGTQRSGVTITEKAKKAGFDIDLEDIFEKPGQE